MKDPNRVFKYPGGTVKIMKFPNATAKLIFPEHTPEEEKKIREGIESAAADIIRTVMRAEAEKAKAKA